jgi:hypothetical protein
MLALEDTADQMRILRELGGMRFDQGTTEIWVARKAKESPATDELRAKKGNILVTDQHPRRMLKTLSI